MSEIETYHQNAKDAGNRLSAFITNASMGAVAVYFVALTQQPAGLSGVERLCLSAALLLFVGTAFLRLLELHLDARRFYAVAVELAKPEGRQDWTRADRLKTRRLSVIWWSYAGFSLAMLASVAFMLMRMA